MTLQKQKKAKFMTWRPMKDDGIYLNGNGRQNMFHPEDEDSVFGTINPKRLEDIIPPVQEEQEKGDINMNWDSEIPF